MARRPNTQTSPAIAQASPGTVTSPASAPREATGPARRTWQSITADALRIAAEGFPVIGCLEDTKRPWQREWYENASTNAGYIRSIFGWYKSRLIGVPTGSKSDLAALDIDVKHGPCIWHDEHAAMLEGTRRHQTPSGGFHYIFRIPPGVVIANSVSKIAQYVDVRGERGQVIWAGNPGYTLDRDLPIRELADFPWLLELMRQASMRRIKGTAGAISQPYPAEFLDDLERYSGAGTIDDPRSLIDTKKQALQLIAEAIARVAAAGPGTRNNTLAKEAFTCGGLIDAAKLTADEVETELLNAVDGHEYQKSRDTIQRCMESGRMQPIDMLQRDEDVVELYRVAHRLLDRGVTADEYLGVLRLLNDERQAPLPVNEIERIALQCARRHGESSNGR